MTPYEVIRLAAKSMDVNESSRGVCLWCHGGNTREKSFVITNLGRTASYSCYRASCNGPSSGVLVVDGSATPIQQARKPPTERKLTDRTYPLSEESMDILHTKFEFTPEICEEYQLTQTEDGDIIIPILNWRGLQQGIERKVKTITVAKALRYNGAESDGMGWFNYPPSYTVEGVDSNFRSEYVILVEDMYSAMKAHYFMNSISLLGVSLSVEQAVEIARHKFEKVIIALDADASATAVKLARRYMAIIPNLRVLRLSKDIKDMSYKEVEALLKKEI